MRIRKKNNTPKKKHFRRVSNEIMFYVCNNCEDIADTDLYNCLCGGTYFPVSEYEGECPFCKNEIDELDKHVYVHKRDKENIICQNCWEALE